VKIIYSALWAFFVFDPLNRRVYWYAPSRLVTLIIYELNITKNRFPTSFPLVCLDFLEKLYLAGFPFLQLFVTIFPLVTYSQQPSPCRIPFVCPEVQPQGGLGDLEFLPLMLTSVYCAVGLVWAFLRLSVIYLREQY